MLRHLHIILFVVLQLQGISYVFAQQDSAKKQLPIIINENNDTIAIYRAEQVVFEEVIDAKTLNENQKKFLRLRRNMMKVYPLAKAASDELKIIDEEMAKLPNKKAQKKYLDAQEQRLKAIYESKLTDLTFEQGMLLIKLVDRQIGRTSYNLIKEYRSGLTALFWQGIASAFNMSLKERYDPLKEPEIEQMLQHLGYK